MFNVTLTFKSKEDLAYFVRMAAEQMEKGKQGSRIGNLGMGILTDTIGKAEKMESELTPEQAKAIIIGKAT